MGCKNQCRLPISQQLAKAQDYGSCRFYAVSFGWLLGIKIPKPVQVRKFRAHAAKIVPATAQDIVNFGFGFFRKSRSKVIAADPIFGEKRTDGAHKSASKIRHFVGVG